MEHPEIPARPHASDQWVNSIRNTGFHMDFGSGMGWRPTHPVVGADPKALSFYYPMSRPISIPASRRSNGGDHHILIVDNSTCTLYELFDASYSGGSWHAGSGAIWDLNSNALRPDTWTSADAAGLPILPGLVRYEEILSGQIDHAIRFVAQLTIWRKASDVGQPKHTVFLDGRASLKAHLMSQGIRLPCR
jgi:hypothetical protein